MIIKSKNLEGRKKRESETRSSVKKGKKKQEAPAGKRKIS